MHSSALRARLALLVALVILGIGVQAPAALAVVDAAAPPVAVDDTKTVRSGKEVSVHVTDNDSDPDFDFVTITAPTETPVPTAHGSVFCFGFGSCSYTSEAGFVGTDGFDYTISDGNGGTDIGHVTITVVANTPPTAVDEELQAVSGHPASGDVLFNDIDPDQGALGDFLTLTAPEPDVESDTPHGRVLCAATGECEYLSDPGYVGADSFDYTVADDTGANDIGHVTVTVAANQAPDAVDDTYARADETVLEVLENDIDPEGVELTITALTPPANGTAAIVNAGRAITYTQTANFSASDSFTYTVSDGHGGMDTATVTLQPCPALGAAIDSGGIVVGERWVACSAIRANGVVGPTTTVFPPQGPTSALLTSGDIALAPGPNDQSGATASNSATELRGALDVSILRLDLMIPAGANCLSFDFAFQSEEYPEFVGSSYNDAFLAELDVSNWSVESSIITAPNNFAFDSVGGIVSVNGSFFEPGRVVEATGSQYDGSTPLLNVRRSVTPGPHALYLTIFDAGDTALDSAAFVDGLAAGAAGPGGCAAGANEPPNAVDDPLPTTPEDTPKDVDVLANDSDPDGNTLTVTTLSPSAQHGTVACTAAGTCTYTPAANYHGPDSFTYGISDGHGGTDTATVSITVAPVNDDPNAVDDTLTTAEDTAGNVNVLVNDTDVDGDTLTVTTLTPTAGHGTVACLATGVCTYTPTTGYSGPDSFSYTVSDGHGGTDAATVSVTVTAPPVNQPPVADDETLTVAEDTPGNVSVLVGDTDPDGDPLTVTSPNPAASHGTVSCTAAGVCTYTPNANYNGSDSFTYTISDAHGGTDTATVSVTVTPVNDDPNAVDNTLTTAEDTAGNVNVLANDTDVDGDTLTVTTLTPTAAHGTVACLATGVCTYTPTTGYSGPDSFSYTVSDGHGGTDTAAVSVTVTPGTPTNTPPVADDDTLTTPEDVSDSVNVVIDDTDADGHPLTVTSTNPTAQHGTVACAPTGTCQYTPAANYHGPDGFDYTISDGHGGTDTGHVSITVTPVNDDPNAVDNTLTTAEDTAGNLNVLANDSDVDGDTLTVTTLTPTAAHGTVACTAAGACTYTPTANYNGSDSFTYAVSDGHGGTDTATVSVTVTPVNDPPVANDDSLTTAQDTAGTVNVRTNDTDVDGGTLSVTGQTNGASGTVVCQSNGDCTYTPNPGFTGSDSFTYTISDGTDTDMATVSVTVTGLANTPPSCADVKPSKTKLWPPRHKFILVTLSGATDADGDPLTFSITQVTQDEKVKGAISKNDKGPDAQRVPGKPNQIKLRAERVGDGNGRVYRIHYVVSDGQGGTCTGIEKVGVPRNKGGNAIDNVGKTYNSFG